MGVVVVGCGSSSGSSSSSESTSSETTPASSEPSSTPEESGAGSASSSESAGSGLPAYTGSSAKLPEGFTEVKEEAGVTFKLAFLNPFSQAPALADAEEHAKSKAEELGGSFIGFNSENSPDKQVTQFTQALNEGATAIICWPVDPQSLTAELEAAKAKGVPVIGIQAGPIVSEGKLPGYETDVTSNYDAASFYNAAAIAKEKPGASFVVMGQQGSEPVLKYLEERLQYWGEKDGLKYEGSVQATGPGPEEAVKAGETILTRYSGIEAIAGIDDLNLAGAVQAAGQKGAQPLITGTNGEKTAVEDIINGKATSTFWYRYSVLGEQAAIGAYSAQTKQNLPLPPIVIPKGVPITKENAAEIVKELSY
jgi:ABC-type sugar transport system substrate-binding protein